MNLDQARPMLVQEARELLAEMDAALLRLEHDGYEAEQVNAVFRAVHTIKGSAGLFALDHLVSFSHTLESVLEQVRAGSTGLDEQLLSLLLRAGDYIGNLVTEVELGREQDDPNPALREQLLGQLNDYLASASEALLSAAAGPQCSTRWNISLRPSAQVLRQGLDPVLFLQHLASTGQIISLHTLTDAIPLGGDFDPQQNYLGYEIQFATANGRESIEAVFEFMQGYCQLEISPLSPLPASAPPVAEAEAGAIVEAVPAVGPASESAALPQRLIKVEVSKLDGLINLVGELVIAEAAARAVPQGQGREEAAEVLAGLVESIRDASLALRMVAVGEVFQRFARVVRDLGRDMHKDIDLHISGADTELDKSMVEKLADPLMHLVRNAIDHGIEPASERLAAGKPARSLLRMNAFHESASVVIEVSDDGRGLDRQRIYTKALELGLLKEEQEVSDQQLCELIFSPGFTTAQSLSNLSGRGVGMDVVRTNIEKLRGEVFVSSVAGQGTTVRVRLPLTLAIIDGFQVVVAGEAFVLPLEQVIECVDFVAAPGHHDWFELRGEALPFVRLRDLFAKPEACGLRESLLVVQYGSSRAGIVVDQLMGELQAVIKPLGALFRQNAFLSGSTILGNGSVALILDVAQLIRQARADSSARHPL